MLATSLTAAVLGVEAHLVRVEADTAPGFPRFTMVGLADSAVKESESRIRAALRNCGIPFKWDRRITVNLAPASLRKYGSSFDLATAVGLLAADGAFPLPHLADVLLVGELALDGALRAGRRRPARCCSWRAATACGAAIVPAREPPGGGARARPARAPRRHAAGGARAPGARTTLPAAPPAPRPRRAPAGSRRPTWPTSAARRSPGGRSRSPPPAATTCCSSARPARARRCWPDACRASCPPSARRGGRDGGDPLRRRPPGRGGGRRAGPSAAPTTRRATWPSWAAAQRPRPGEVSLAHNGVLFLDELPEFRRATLEVLRQPLEEGHVTVARHRGAFRMPARFQLVAAMNPCPCGRRGSLAGGLLLHAGRGPLLPGPALRPAARPHRPARARPRPGLRRGARARRARRRPSVRGRVAAARERQARRSGGPGRPASNAALPCGRAPPGGRARDRTAQRLLRQAVDRLGLSARGLDRLLRVARTIADLDDSEEVSCQDLAEALQFRRCVGDTAGWPAHFNFLESCLDAPRDGRASLPRSLPYRWVAAPRAGAHQVCVDAGGGRPDGWERWMANEFYTLIVVPHAKARFRKFQVSVRLTRWVLAAFGVLALRPGGHPRPLHLDRGRGRRDPAAAGREPGPRDQGQGLRGERRPAAGQGAAAAEHRHEARHHGRGRAEPARRLHRRASAASPGARRRLPRWTSPRPCRASTRPSGSLSEKSTKLEAFFKDQRAAAGLDALDLAGARLPLGGLRQPDRPVHGPAATSTPASTSRSPGAARSPRRPTASWSSAGPKNGYGNIIVVDHGYGIVTRYGHLDGFNVRPGQRVRRGDVIGFGGNTGPLDRAPPALRGVGQRPDAQPDRVHHRRVPELRVSRGVLRRTPLDAPLAPPE